LLITDENKKALRSCKNKANGIMLIKFKDGKDRELEITTSSVEEVLRKLEINPMEVVVKRDDTIILEEEILTNEDEITVIKVIFGG